MKIKLYKKIPKEPLRQLQDNNGKSGCKGHFQSITNNYRNKHTFIKEICEFNINVFLYCYIVFDNYEQLFIFNPFF